jgi:hypothetical protein
MHMYELGKKSECFGTENLVPVSVLGRPTDMPSCPHPQGYVICGCHQGLEEQLFVCESLADMQELYDAYADAYAINWYTGHDVGFWIVLDIEEDFQVDTEDA